jgi:hypothetical protein
LARTHRRARREGNERRRWRGIGRRRLGLGFDGTAAEVAFKREKELHASL